MASDRAGVADGIRVIDAHLHVWDPARVSYPWLQPGPLCRRFDLEEVAPRLGEAGVDGVVLVQAADSVEDTRHMVEVARGHPIVRGVVAWVPLDRPDEAAALLDGYADDDLVVGIRSLVHDQPDPDWIVRDDVDAGLAVLAGAGFPFDYVTSGPAALRHLPGIAERHPALRVAIDHLGKPPVGGSGRQRSEWRALLAAAAENPNAVAKLSGLYSSVGDLADWTPASIRPFVDDALELFGPDRLMYGGDWPVSLLAGGYERCWRGITAALPGLDGGARAAILGGTATAFYGL